MKIGTNLLLAVLLAPMTTAAPAQAFSQNLNIRPELELDAETAPRPTLQARSPYFNSPSLPPWGPSIEHRLHQQFDSGPVLSPEYCFGQLLVRPISSKDKSTTKSHTKGHTKNNAKTTSKSTPAPSCVSTHGRFAAQTPCGNFKVGLYHDRLVVVNLSFAYNQPASLCTLGLDAQLTCRADAIALDSKMEWVGGRLRPREAGKKEFALEDITRGGYLDKEVKAVPGGGWEIVCADQVANTYFPYQAQQ
ncbi:MAG: hypothetical protein M1829_003841 [Trizodia sp. TS-e1964]|nr:MAG: hypothetical protein M1829_003841 [Trizodia sp. TS-e1964]